MEKAVTEYLSKLNIPISVRYCKNLLKQTVQHKNIAVQNEMAAVRLKNSPEVFMSLLYKQRQVDTTLFEHDFLIGSPDAPVKLTMAVNLFCGPCKNELEQAKELLSVYPEQVSLSLRFLKSKNKEETSSLLLKKWLQSSINKSNGDLDGQTLIEAWFRTMDKEIFTKSNASNGTVSVSAAEKYTQNHYNWIKEAEIVNTPNTFINSYELPSTYRIKDLSVLIPGLVATFDNKAYVS